MDKVKLELKTPENVKIKYNDIEIEVKPKLDLVTQLFLIERYIKDYFGTPENILIENTKYHFIEAEIELKYLVIQFNTNIDIDNLDNDIYVEDDLWEKIYSSINNWYSFIEALYSIVNDIKQQETLESSIGKTVSDLIQKGYALLDKISDMDVEEIRKAGERGTELMERLEKSSILKNPSDVAAIVEGATNQQETEKPVVKKGRKKKVE